MAFAFFGGLLSPPPPPRAQNDAWHQPSKQVPSFSIHLPGQAHTHVGPSVDSPAFVWGTAELLCMKS